MPSSRNVFTSYQRVMEETGFYVNGKPTEGIIESHGLLSGSQVDKRIKYSAVIDSRKLGATAIFELSGSPCIYFKYFESEPTSAALASLHKLAWNQGLAPMLWIVTPTHVRIFNCYSKPDNMTSPNSHLIEMFEIVEEGLRQLKEFAGRLQIESGQFWSKAKARSIDRQQRVDVALLEQLMQAEKQLVEQGLDRVVAHALLGRSIFVSYLQDRGILKPQFFRSRFKAERFTDVLESKSNTYDLFGWIEETFNGDLFPLKRSDGRAVHERNLVEPNHLRVIQTLLMGTDYKTGQQSLWPYNFDVIPVELISSIYEMFAHASDAESARKRSTHYTPINIVDLVLSEVFADLSAESSILDPACGSGVFLVESLRRLVARRVAGGEALSRKMIRETLYNQVFGIDINKEAVQIAAFSLYLTALELDPDPQPPSALTFRSLIGANLFADDAFDEGAEFNDQSYFAKQEFDAIVGNPPWKRSKSNNGAITYCAKHDYPLTRNNPDQAFLWRVRDFASENARIGMILSSKPFFSQTRQAMKTKTALFSHLSPKVLFNLSSLRNDKLFPTSTAPAAILIAEARMPSVRESFSFVNIERTEAFKRHGIIEIQPENVKRLSVQSLVSDPNILKVAMWGGARDMALIQRLQRSFPSLESFWSDPGWVKGQGYQTAGGNKKMPKSLVGKPWLKSGELTRFYIETRKLPKMPEVITFLSPRDPKIYRGPLVVAVRGIGREGFKAAFAASDVIYTEEYYGFTLPRSAGIRPARYLNAILNSSLATYYLFLTSSVWGIERDKVEPNDLLSLPIPRIEESRKREIDTVLKAEQAIRSSLANHETPTNHMLSQLDEAVFNLFDLDETERVLVRDTVSLTINLRMKHTRSIALKRPSMTEVELYAKQLINIIQPFLETLNERTMTADVFDVGRAPLQVVRLNMLPALGHSPGTSIVDGQDLDAILGKIAQQLPNRIAGSVYARRVLRIYSNDALYIIKPAQLRYWSRSSGLNDADAIIAEHMRTAHDLA